MPSHIDPKIESQEELKIETIESGVLVKGMSAQEVTDAVLAYQNQEAEV